MSMKHIHLVINPGAGQPQPVLHQINSVFYEAGVDWSVSVTTAQRDATTLTRAAVENGAELVVAYGGDGTVNEVVRGLLDTGIPLGLLHGGTGNALAHELGIPAAMAEAAALLIGEHDRRRLDVGRVTPDSAPDTPGTFILRSSIGLQNRILEEATPERKQQFGNFAYLMAGLRSLSKGEPQQFRLTVDGETFTAEGVSCLIANSATVGGAASFVFAPDVDPTDGMLDLFVLDTRLESVVAMMNSSLGANLEAYPNHRRGREIRVEMDAPATVTLDGESFAETPVQIDVLPGAVEVIVPR